MTSPAMVCSVGNVNTGACDPASAICDIAHAANAWVHVDGAFGLWAAAIPNESMSLPASKKRIVGHRLSQVVECSL